MQPDLLLVTLGRSATGFDEVDQGPSQSKPSRRCYFIDSPPTICRINATREIFWARTRPGSFDNPFVENESAGNMAEESVREWLALWHRLLDEPDLPPFNEPDDMAGVLADLRRYPDRLASAFAPLPCGDELLARVTRCIDAAKQHDGIYLIPDPVDSTDDELRALVTESIARGCECCEIDPPSYPVHIKRRAITREESQQAAPLVEELGDLYIGFAFDGRGPESEAMHFLREALYTLAASFEVQGYCLTPLCPDEIRRLDPYQPQLELWLRGAQAVVRWDDNSDNYWIDVFVGS